MVYQDWLVWNLLYRIGQDFLRLSTGKRNFAIPESIGVPLNFFLILFILLSVKTGLTVLAIGSVVAFASSCYYCFLFFIKRIQILFRARHQR